MLWISPPAAAGQTRHRRGCLQDQHAAESEHVLEHAKATTGNPTVRAEQGTPQRHQGMWREF